MSFALIRTTIRDSGTGALYGIPHNCKDGLYIEIDPWLSYQLLNQSFGLNKHTDIHIQITL